MKGEKSARAGLFAVVTLVLSAGLVIASWSIPGTQHAPPGVPDDAHAAFPGKPGKIVFDRYLRGSGPTERKAVYVTKSNGEGLRMLTEGREPNFSADGRQIVFARRGKDGVQSIYKMKADGTKVRRLTTTRTLDGGPAWSPNGNWIVFARQKWGKQAWPPKESDIYKMKANGSDQTRLTNSPEHEDAPDWSPNGKRIAYASAKGTVTMKPNGSDKRVLGGGEPDWSPNGKQIAFDAFDREGQEGQIWVMAANGKEAHAVGPGDELNGNNSAWSPDGTEIAFVGYHPPGGDEEGFIGIFKMNADGTNVVQLTVGGKPGDFGVNDAFPDWQPR